MLTAAQVQVTEGVVNAMEKQKLDLMVALTAADPFSTYVACLGLPAITVPIGCFLENTIVKGDEVV